MVTGRMNANKILADPEKLRVRQIADITANFTQTFFAAASEKCFCSYAKKWWPAFAFPVPLVSKTIPLASWSDSQSNFQYSSLSAS